MSFMQGLLSSRITVQTKVCKYSSGEGDANKVYIAYCHELEPLHEWMHTFFSLAIECR